MPLDIWCKGKSKIIMNWKVIKTEAAYQKAIKRTLAIFQAKEGTKEADELALLLVLVKDYESRHIHLPNVNPIEVVKMKMEERGMKAKDLENGAEIKGLFSITRRNIFTFGMTVEKL